MTHIADRDTGPWYKQTWAWFVLTPLIVVVIASMNFVYIAFSHQDDVVMDDYYKEGRTINQHFSLDETAKALELDGQLEIDLQVGDVVLDLRSLAALPAQLTLELSHPVESAEDLTLLLKEVAPGRYMGELEKRLENRWYVRLSAAAIDTLDGQPGVAAWRLNGELNLALGSRLVFNEPSPSHTIDLPPGVEPVEVTAAKAAAQHQ